MKSLLLLCTLLLFLSCLRGKPDFLSENIKNAKSEELEGALYMILSDFGALQQHGLGSNILPFKTYMTALLMQEGFDPRTGNTKEKMKEILKRYGLLVDSKVANMPEGYQLDNVEYLTLFKGTMKADRGPFKLRMEATGFSCASCHGGHTYDSQGNPLTDEFYLGTPNSSLNIEKFTSEIFSAFLKVKDKKKTFLRYMMRVFPNLTKAEYRTIRDTFKSEVRNKMNLLKNNLGRVFPVINGGAGLTNGVGSLKFQLGLINNNKREYNETGYTSVPTMYDRSFRNNLLYDGVYNPLSPAVTPEEHEENLAKIIAFFTVSTSANTIETAATKFEEVKKVLKFIKTAERPAYPGEVDYAKAARGQKIYKNKCSKCHGVYTDELSKNGPKLVSYPNKLVDLDKIGTDPSRVEVIDDKFINAINNSEMGQHLKAEKNYGYLATILTGVWNTAPFLHNGSVPTLWALMNPSKRPEKFLVGGHKFDISKVGIRHDAVNESGVSIYEDDYQPWSLPEIYDTTLKGKGNQGHEFPFSKMSDSEKWDVIEYLKLL